MSLNHIQLLLYHPGPLHLQLLVQLQQLLRNLQLSLRRIINLLLLWVP